MTWEAVGLTLLAAAFGFAASLIVSSRAMRHATREREAADRTRRRERAEDAVAWVRALLDEADPTPILIGLSGSDRGERHSQELWTRYRELRGPLLVYVGAVPSVEVQRLASELRAAVAFSIQATRDALAAPAGEVRAEARRVAQELYDEAVRLTDDLLAALRASDG